MLAEIKKIGEFLKSDKDVRELRNQILIILAIFIALLLANRFIFINFTDRGEYYLGIIRTKIAFAGNVSVYGVDINPDQATLSKIGIDTLDSSKPFFLPLFALIFYYPFSLIQNFDWSLAFWLTTNQILVYFIIREFLNVIKWKINARYQYVITLVALVCYFVYYNFFGIGLSFIQLFLIVFALGKIRTKEYIFAGILLGLSLSDPYQFLIPMVILLLLNLTNRRGTVNTWVIITVFLLSLFMIIFDMRWVLENLRILLLESTTYPVISYGEYLSSVFPRANKLFFEVIPIIIYSWLVIEWLRMPKDNYLQEMWIICLTFTLNTMLHSWTTPNTISSFLIVTLFTTSLWFNRSTQKFKYFAVALYALVLIIIPIVQLFLNKGVLENNTIFWVNISFFMILILNLYWVRLWVVNPYYAVNSVDDEY